MSAPIFSSSTVYHRSSVKVRPIVLASIHLSNSLAAIRVFGIYTHAQLDKRLWDLMGYQLSRKGREYRRRYVSTCGRMQCRLTCLLTVARFEPSPCIKVTKSYPLLLSQPQYLPTPTLYLMSPLSSMMKY